jgi:protein TonB
MAENKIHVESLDEIVFANRNKEYGAYQIRRLYPKFLNRSASVSILAILIAVAVPLIASYYQQKRYVREDKTVGVEFAEMNKPPEETAPPPPPPPPEALEQKVKFTAPVVVQDTVVESDALNQDDLKQTVTNVALTAEDFNTEVKEEVQVIEEEDKTPIFTVVEEMPGFPGGEEARLKFLQDNIQYPQVAKESGISGTVYVSFVVDSKGRVTEAKILRGIGGGCDDEALRVIKLMPPWNPGKQAGKPVRVQFTMPIRFTLN